MSATEPSFHVEAYRLGWYQGNGGRLVWQSPEIPGRAQAAPSVAPGVNMAEANWEPSAEVTIDEQFVPGVYVLKLVGPNFAQRIPLTIRDDARGAAYMVQSSVTSWQAYNPWGGYSLYAGANGAFATRARIVSFDRPYARGGGSDDLLGLEHPLIQLMESLGLDVTYTTDVDTHGHPERLLAHKAFLSLGHDEYWSKEMRDGVEAARDHGVNLVFFGANAAFRQIRFESSARGELRHEVCYKSAREDPLRTQDPARVTVDWRAPPVLRPESAMIGQQYECNPVQADMVIVDPGAWVFTGANVVEGQRIVGIVGSEYDRYYPGQVGPHNVQIFSHSPVTCHDRPGFSDMTYYTAASNAGVFATGTINWITRLAPRSASADPVAVQVTKNVLAAFGVGPAGASHAAAPNYDAIAAKFGA